MFLSRTPRHTEFRVPLVVIERPTRGKTACYTRFHEGRASQELFARADKHVIQPREQEPLAIRVREAQTLRCAKEYKYGAQEEVLD